LEEHIDVSIWYNGIRDRQGLITLIERRLSEPVPCKYKSENTNGGVFIIEKGYVTLIKIKHNGISVDAKKCTKCSIVKPLEGFNKRKEGLGGKNSRCRKCYNELTKDRKSEYDKQYRVINRDKLLKRSIDYHYETREYANKKRSERYYKFHETEKENRRIYHDENREELNKKKKIYYKENKDRFIQYRLINRDRISDCKKKHYRENKETYADRWKEYHNEHKEEIREHQRKFYKENCEEQKARWREYYRSPKGQEASKRASHKRRELENGLDATLTSEQWQLAQSHFENKCAYCGGDEKMTMDHFVPVSKSGELSVGNIIPCCGSCNYSKRDSDFSDWYIKKPFYSKGRETKIRKYLGYEKNRQQMALF